MHLAQNPEKVTVYSRDNSVTWQGDFTPLYKNKTLKQLPAVDLLDNSKVKSDHNVFFSAMNIS